MQLLLKIRHWTLLLLMILPSIVISIFSISEFGGFIGSIWALFVYQAWLYSIVCISQREKRGRSHADKAFFYSITYNAIYVVFLLMYFFSDKNDFAYWQIPIHLIAFITSFYVIFFSAKTLVRIEEELNLKSYDTFTTFVLMWFFPIGIFFIQNKLNTIDRVSK